MSVIISWNELFHCLSRLFPEFRKAMYALIHFTVLDQEIELPQEIRDEFVANPDVEHHDSTALFTINGEKKECCLVFMTDSAFEKPGDDFFEGMYTGVVPLDEFVIYRENDVPDFLDVVGGNTYYTMDPEEIMADNFSLTILLIDEGFDDWPTPEIAEGIIAYLKNGN